MTTHNDLAGKKIKRGDYIVYAALWSRSAVLKYGVVSSLKEREVWSQRENNSVVGTLGVISVDRTWDGKWELQNHGKEITLGFLDRCLVVNANSVPREAVSLLASTFSQIER